MKVDIRIRTVTEEELKNIPAEFQPYDDALHTVVNVEHVKFSQKLQVMHALAHGLHLTKEDIMMYAIGESEGYFEMTTTHRHETPEESEEHEG